MVERSKQEGVPSGFTDIKQALKAGEMTTDVIQAVNRICCRKVIDESGTVPRLKL